MAIERAFPVNTVYKRSIVFTSADLREGMEADGKADFGRHDHPHAHVRQHGGLEAEFLNAARLSAFPFGIGISVAVSFVFGDQRLFAFLRRRAVTKADVVEYGFLLQPIRNVLNGELSEGDDAALRQSHIVQRRNRERHNNILKDYCFDD